MANIYELIDVIYDELERGEESFVPTISEESIPFNTMFKREVVNNRRFYRLWQKIGLTNQEFVNKVEKPLKLNPEKGELVKEYNADEVTGSDLWKLDVSTRIDSCRVVYAYYPKFNAVYLVDVYKKSEAPDKKHGNLTANEWNVLARASKNLREHLKDSIKYEGWRDFYEEQR